MAEKPYSDATGQVERAAADLSELDEAKARQVDLQESTEGQRDVEGEQRPHDVQPPTDPPDGPEAGEA